MFHVLDPDRFLNRTVKYVRWIWTPPVVDRNGRSPRSGRSASSSSTGTRSGRGRWSSTTSSGSRSSTILQFFVILCVIGLIHEFAHAYASRSTAAKCHDIGFALFYFTPAFYCDTTDAFMFKNRWHRLWVTIAGIYIEAHDLLGRDGALGRVVSRHASSTQPLTRSMLFTGVSTVFFNINPLIKVDGYYALSSLLEMPDLRESRVAPGRRVVPEARPAAARRGAGDDAAQAADLLDLRAPLDGLHRDDHALHLQAVPELLLQVLPRYRRSSCCSLTLYQIFRKKARTLIRVAKLFYLDKKELLMSPRSRIPLAATAAVLLLVLARALEPPDHRRRRIPEAGGGGQRPGARGRDRHEGTRPARDNWSNADNRSFACRARSWRRRPDAPSPSGELHAGKSSGNRAVANAMMTFQSASRAAAAQTALETRRVSPGLPDRPQSDRRPHPDASPGGSRRPLRRRRALRSREVGDCRKMVAEVPVSERLLEYLKIGAPVTAQVQTRPMKSYAGAVATISPATIEQPQTADGKDPVAPSVNPDRFVVRAVFDNADGSLLPGAAASVKIRSAREGFRFPRVEPRLALAPLDRLVKKNAPRLRGVSIWPRGSQKFSVPESLTPAP